ncbi:MAG TPA: Wzy polymerase domain-containing protein [Thermoanaerobaculia bacterium]|nr:Wzy polymerase domain-containing protein [Thermoanaerobaculia bacterium]
MSDPPGKIGPYSILERLGAGGMGEVFLAYDERLDRKVAIKRIRLEKGSDPDRRERFRREARIAARLNHPSIVQVYDVRAEGESDCIVLEHVEGEDLRGLLRRGPLSVGQTVSIALDVARGLEEAHRQGIVHRDLKTENVLVTPSGRAKIVDFGIAKRMLREEDERSLTMDGHVLGTCRSMSPEQARGEPVDHRSDLFSFGVLLYEALTGRSPFEAENELATIQRILRHRQTPVREVRGEAPKELSDLIDQLLQKDPRLRPRNAGEVARALMALPGPAPLGTGETTIAEPAPWAQPTWEEPLPKSSVLTGSQRFRPRILAFGVLLVLAGAGFYFAISQEGDPLYVAVMPPEIASGGKTETTDLLALAVRDSLVRGLVSLQGISPKDAEDLRGISDSPVRAAKAAGADEVVRSRLYCQPEACRITLDRIRGTDGSLLGSESFDVPTDDFFLIATAVTNQLRQSYPDHKIRDPASDLQVSGSDLQEFLRLHRKYESRQDASLETLLDQLAAIRRRAPRFLDVYLLEAKVARRRFYTSRDPADLSRGLAVIEEARRLFPKNPQPLFSQIDLALASQDLDLAQKTLEELETLLPGDVRLLERRARILSARGESKEALAQLREAADLQPSARRLHNLAQMELVQGEIAMARQHLDLLFQRSPNDFDGLSLLASIEMTSGDLERAVDLYRELVRRSPGPTELSNLALCYSLSGRYPEATQVLERLLAETPKHPLYTLNLADAYFLSGRERDAEAAYGRVLDLIAADPSATNAQSVTMKAQALAHLGRRREAVAAVQEALRLAPDDGFVAYEASLVYALLGEDESALFNAERAMKLGLDSRWFSFPWFDALRRHLLSRED